MLWAAATFGVSFPFSLKLKFPLYLVTASLTSQTPNQHGFMAFLFLLPLSILLFKEAAEIYGLPALSVLPEILLKLS